MTTVTPETQTVCLRAEEGSGRSLVILEEAGVAPAYGLSLLRKLSTRMRVLLVETPRIKDANWGFVTEEVKQLLDAKGVRQVSVVGLSSAGAVAQNFCLHYLKSVRTLALVDSPARPHPTTRTTWLDTVESLLPLGLPFRSRIQGFDGKPFLHRLRCPTLIVLTPQAAAFLRSEARVMAGRCPTAWIKDISEAQSEDAALHSLSDAIYDFQDVPAKCPQ